MRLDLSNVSLNIIRLY